MIQMHQEKIPSELELQKFLACHVRDTDCGIHYTLDYSRESVTGISGIPLHDDAQIALNLEWAVARSTAAGAVTCNLTTWHDTWVSMWAVFHCRWRHMFMGWQRSPTGHWSMDWDHTTTASLSAERVGPERSVWAVPPLCSLIILLMQLPVIVGVW